jgi:hypothetical protein
MSMSKAASTALFRLSLAAFFFAFGADASAATLTQQQDRLFVSGFLQVDDLKNVEVAKIRTVVFQQSLGGTVEGAMHYVDVIKSNRLNTVVHGKCYSACAIAFLAGKERRADSSNVISAVLLHVGRTRTQTGEREFADNDSLMKNIDELTNHRLTPEVRDLVRKSWSEAAGVVFVFGPGLFGPRFKTLYCDGTQGVDTSKCKSLENADALLLGIVTAK